jgi:hypothetical protein
VHFLVKAGCSRHYINDVIHVVLKSAGVTAIGTISHTTVSRIITEGYIAAQIQLGYELGNAKSMYIIHDKGVQTCLYYLIRYDI